MVRIGSATVLGAVVAFFWSFAAWTYLPLHRDTIRNLPNEQAVRAALTPKLETGYYFIPGMPEEDAQTSEEEKKKKEEAWKKKHRQGPVASIIYTPSAEPMPPLTFIKGFAIYLASAFVAALLLSSAGCCRNYFQRVGFVFGLGLFASLVSHVQLWNWMHYPLDYTLAMVADVLIGWTLVGIVIAVMIRPKVQSAG